MQGEFLLEDLHHDAEDGKSFGGTFQLVRRERVPEDGDDFHEDLASEVTEQTRDCEEDVIDEPEDGEADPADDRRDGAAEAFPSIH